MAPSSNAAAGESIELVARAAAVREAEAEIVKLDSRIELARSLIASRRHRQEQRAEERLELQARAQELQSITEAARDRVDMLHEGVAASEMRIALSRRSLAESSPKLEALRTRHAVAEEQHRIETIQIGSLCERLRERKQQLVALQRYALDQRIRVGLVSWRARQAKEEALLRWRATALQEQVAAKRQTIEGAVIL